MGESYYEENRHFFSYIAEGLRPIVTEDNGLEARRVSLAILESSKASGTPRNMKPK